MSLGYKDQIQAIFEEMVFDEFGCEYWDCPKDAQYRLFQKASLEYSDRLADRADMLRDIEKERPR